MLGGEHAKICQNVCTALTISIPCLEEMLIYANYEYANVVISLIVYCILLGFIYLNILTHYL